MRVEVLGVAPMTYTTEAALALADKAASFGDEPSVKLKAKSKRVK